MMPNNDPTSENTKDLREICAQIHFSDNGIPNNALDYLQSLPTTLPAFLIEAANQGDEPARNEVARLIGGHTLPLTLEVLFPMLSDSLYPIRKVALNLLSLLGEPGRSLSSKGAIEALLSPGSNTWIAALDIMKAHGDVSIIPLVLAALDYPERHVRRRALDLLVTFAPQVSLLELQPCLQDDDWFVREGAFIVLGNSAIPNKIDLLLDAVQSEGLHEDGIFTRPTALRELSRFAEQVAFSTVFALLQQSALPIHLEILWLGRWGKQVPAQVWVDFLHSDDVAVRYRATLNLGYQGEVDVLLALLFDPTMRHVAEFIGEALAPHRNEIAIGPIMALLNSPYDEVRAAAITILGSQAPLDILFRLLHDDAPRTRYAAGMVLTREDCWTTAEAALEILRNANKGGIDAKMLVAQRTIANLGKEAPITDLEQIYGDGDKGVRYRVLQVSGRLGEHAPVDFILHALQDPDENIKGTACYIVAELHLSQALPMLYEMLNDPKMQLSAAEAIAHLGGTLPVEVINRYVETLSSYPEGDDNWDINALEDIAVLGAAMPAEPVLAVLGERDEYLCAAALQTLTATHPEALQPALREAEAILCGEQAGPILASISRVACAEVIGRMRYVTLDLVAVLTDFLDWHYWRVRWSGRTTGKRGGQVSGVQRGISVWDTSERAA